MQDAAKKEADERYDGALNPSFRELEESRRHEAGDERGYCPDC